jgi:hypothetical protein
MDRMILQDGISIIILSIIVLYIFFLLWFRRCRVGGNCSRMFSGCFNGATGLADNSKIRIFNRRKRF